MQRHTGPLSGERAATRIAWYKHARSIPAGALAEVPGAVCRQLAILARRNTAFLLN
jgi:hypothetical protein